MERLALISLFLVACYGEDLDAIDQGVECVELPMACEPERAYDPCIEFSEESDPCAWQQCMQTTGQHGTWVAPRRCLREECGIPFNEDCFAQFRALMLDCFANRCHTISDALSCAVWDRKAQESCSYEDE